MRFKSQIIKISITYNYRDFESKDQEIHPWIKSIKANKCGQNIRENSNKNGNKSKAEILILGICLRDLSTSSNCYL